MRSVATALLAILAAAQAQEPLIRVTTRMVEVNVVVRDRSGPARGLTRDDFVLLDKGKPQQIAAFSSVELRAHIGDAPASPPRAANIRSNRPEERAALPSSTTVVLLDGVNTEIQDQPYAKRQFLQFLKQVRPEDRIAVYALGSTLRVLHDFTSDARSLVAAVAKHTGDNPGLVDASAGTVTDTGDITLDAWMNESSGMIADRAIIDRASKTAAALEAIGNHIARLPGRKNLVWVSGSFPFAIGHFGSDGVANWEDAAFDQQISGGRGKANSGGGAAASGALYGVNIHDGSPARAQVNFDEILRRATRALNDADISVYPVDARGLIAMPASMMASGATPVNRASLNQRASSPSTIPVGRSTMQMLAEATGGRVFDNTNDIQGAIRAAIDDSEVTYTLGFYPDAKGLDSKFHDLKVQVKRPGVDIRFRKGYLASADASVSDKQRGEEIAAAVSTALEAAGIGLKAVAEAAEKPAGGIVVTVAIDPKDLSFETVEGKRLAVIDVAFSPRAADGHDLGTATQTLRLNLEPARYAAVLEQGITVNKNFPADAKRSQVRVAVFDRGSGKLGSVAVPGAGQ
jgi:VWFA-related protein